MTAVVHVGDALAVLRTMVSDSVHCCVTSPPYWGLRDYGVEGQLGLEETPQQFIAAMVAVFDEVRRVLLPDGVAWVNMGDSYASGGKGGGGSFMAMRGAGEAAWSHRKNAKGWRSAPEDYKHKDLLGMPWRLAFALQESGWWLRSDCIWHKPNPMPESVTDRPTKAHEYVFLLTKSARYFYDADAVKEPGVDTGEPDAPVNDPNWDGRRDGTVPGKGDAHTSGTRGGNLSRAYEGFNWAERGRSLRTVWTIATQPYHGAHFATFPEALAERCIKAGCPDGGTVLDPFTGSGTTGAVAIALGRAFVGIELNPKYAEMARARINAVAPLFVRAAQ